jgi:hypothetical protein
MQAGHGVYWPQPMEMPWLQLGTPTEGLRSTSWSVASITALAGHTSVSIRFCRQTKRIWRVMECSTSPHANRERGYQVCISVSARTGIVGAIVVGPCLLPDRLTVQRCRAFLESVLLHLLQVVYLLWFHQDRAPARYGEDVRRWLSATGLDVEGRLLGS